MMSTTNLYLACVQREETCPRRGLRSDIDSARWRSRGHGVEAHRSVTGDASLVLPAVEPCSE